MAGTTYEYIINLRDKMSGVLRKTGTAGAETLNRLTQQQEKLNASTKRSEGMFSSLGGTLAKLGMGFSAFRIGKTIFSAGADIEQTRVSFEVLLGSLEKGNDLIAKIRDYGATSPYESKGLQDNAKMMLGFGVAAEKVMPTMKMLGDVAMGNQEKMNALTLAFSQVSSAGKLQGQDLLQMINAGFNPLSMMADDLSKKLGITQVAAMQNLRKEMEKGNITAQMMEATFIKATSEGGRFFNMAEKQGQTLNGRFSTLKDNIAMMWTEFGESANGGFKKAVEKLITLTDYVRAHVADIVSFFSKVFTVIGNVFSAIYKVVTWWFEALNKGNPIVILFTAVMTGALVALAAYNVYMTTMAAVTKVWTAVQAAFNAVMTMNPVYLIISGIVALIAAIGYVIYKTDGWGKTWNNVMQYIKHSFEQAGAFLNLKWLQVQNTFLSGFELIQKGWYKLQSLWDKDAANAGLSALNGQGNARAEAILSAKGKVSELASARKQMKVMELSWNNKTIGDMVGGIKESLGLNTPAMAGAGSAGTTGLGATDSTIDGLSTGIADGGNRPTNITINLHNLVESLNITSSTIKEGANEIETQVREALLRVLNSANGVAYGN
jgi:tape measure domain-containing protein